MSHSHQSSSSSLFSKKKKPSIEIPKDCSCTENDFRKKIIFDSLDFEFNISVFCFQLIAHLFLPLLFIFSPNTRAQGLRFTVVHTWFNVAQPIIMYIVLISYFLLEDHDQILLGNYTFVIPLLLFITHRATIALKYASLSITEYERFMQCHDDDMISSYTTQMQLFSGWLSLDTYLIAFELSAASSRIGVKMNQIYFRIPCTYTKVEIPLSSLPTTTGTPADGAIGTLPIDSNASAQTEVHAFSWVDDLSDSTKGSSNEEKNSSSSNQQPSKPQFQKVLDVKTLNHLQHWTAFLSDEEVNRVPILKADTHTYPSGTTAAHIHPQKHIQIASEYQPPHQMILLSNGDFGISVYDVCSAVVRRVRRGSIGYAMVPGFFLSLALTAILLCNGIVSFSELHSPILSLVHLVTGSFIILQFGTLFFAFLMVAIFDVYRFYSMVKILHSMIRLTDLMMHRNVVLPTTAASLTGKCYQQSHHIAKDRQKSILSISRPAMEKHCMRMRKAHGLAASMTEQEDQDEQEQVMEFEVYGQDFEPITRQSFFGKSGQLLATPLKDHEHEGNGFEFKLPPPAGTLYPSTGQTDININRSGSGDDNDGLSCGMTFAMIPKIDLYYSDNATAWIYARLAIQNFGLRFRYRTDTYVAFTLFLIIVMMLIALVGMITTVEKTDMYTSPLFLQSIVIVFLFVLDMAAISFLGSRANEELRKHCRTLAAHAMKIKTKLYRFYSKEHEHEKHLFDKDQLEHALSTLQEIKDVAEINNELQPFKMVGLTATNGLTASILTTAISFFSVLFSVSTGGTSLPMVDKL